MNVLVLGGTQFVGRHIAETLLAAGHAVSVFTRGLTPDELPAAIERLRGDRDLGTAGLHVLTDRSWDVCVDVSGYTARQVRASAETLRSSVKRYVFISAISVYGDPGQRPVQETHPLLASAGEDVTEVNGETYGPLKVTCENIVREIFPDRFTVLRPQVVIGPHDPSGRYAYWLQRAMQGGEMLAPGDGSDHLQLIDVRDLARFVTTVIENNIGGTFNLAGPRFTWADFMQLIGAARVAWVPADLIQAAGLTFMELPLYRPERGPRSSLMDVSNARARAAGLTLTDPAASVREVRAWIADREPQSMLSPAREAELIRLARAGS